MSMLQCAMFLWDDLTRYYESFQRKETSILHLDEGILLEIFDLLGILDSLRAGQVCKQWYRISRDYYLWKSLDLRTLRKTFPKENATEHFLREYPVSRLINLDLSGLELSALAFTILATNCPHLRKLVLNSTNFESEKNEQNLFLFPTELEYLDLRFSNGAAFFYLTISKYLRSQLKWFGICDAFIYALYKDGSLETSFSNMQNLKRLDTSHCLLAKDNLVSMAASCRKLEVLSMRKCLCIRGYTLDELLSNCTSLKGLILDGTSVDDDVVTSLPWEHTRINYLELGGCSLVSAEGLCVVLEKLSRSKSLEYLGLGGIGDGKAINDVVLEDFKMFLSKGLYCSLRTLNIASSDRTTEKGLRSFMEQCCPFIEVIVDNSSGVEKCPIQKNAQTGRTWTWRDENNDDQSENRRHDFRSKNQMEQFYLESPL